MANSVYKDIHPDDRSYHKIETNKLWSITSAKASASYGILTYEAISGSIKDSNFRVDGTSNGVYKRLLWKYNNNICVEQFREKPYAAGDHDRQFLNDIGGVPPIFERSKRQKSLAQGSETSNASQTDPPAEGQIMEYADLGGVQIPTFLHGTASILSIPKRIFGASIQRGTFEVISSSAVAGGDQRHVITDNGYGQLVSASHGTTVPIGDIFYDKGLAVITNLSHSCQHIFNGYSTLKFRGVHDVHSYEYTCRATEREYNMTLNPSMLQTDSSIRTAAAGGFPGGERISLNFNKALTYQPNNESSHPSASINQTIHTKGGASLAIKFLAASSSNYLKVVSQGGSKKYAYFKFREKPGVLYTLRFNYAQGDINGRVYKSQNGEHWSETYTETQDDIEIHWAASGDKMTEIRFGAEGAAGKFAYYDKIELTSDQRQLTGLTKIKGIATHSSFQPYITTVGLYNSFNELLAIGKLPKPIKKPEKYDISFQLKFDK